MKEFRFRILLILGALALSIYLLYPTYSDSQYTAEITESLSVIKENIKVSNPTISAADLNDILRIKEDSIKTADPAIRVAREKRMKLGLDLQGGMYLVMEVNTANLLERVAKDPDDAFRKALGEAEVESRLSEENVVTILVRKLQAEGIRLSRYFGSIRENDDEIIDRLEEQEEDAVSRAIEIISNRVNQYGVSEPSIEKQGSRRIIIQLPGLSNEDEAKRLLQGRAVLEFRFVKDSDFTIPIMNRIDEVLAASSNGIKDSSVTTDSSSADLSKEEFAKQHPFFSVALINPQSPYADAFVSDKDRDIILSYLKRPEIKNVVPDNVEFVFSAKPEINQEGTDIYKMYLVNKTAELTGGVIEEAQANIDPQTTEPVVTMSMNSDGARDWARITGSNVGKRIAVILDGYIYSAPVIQEKIPGGNTRISGMENLEESKLMEIVLKAGSLPASVEIMEERTVGPSLGQDSINQGVTSLLIGFLLVAVFMIYYYKSSGSIADLALFFTMVFIMGILAGFQATLTLPGFAGLILTIGMAVDANVLIYERIREELATGKTVKAAIESGYAHSYSAIFDSNITTFFTGVILYQFGSGPVQGFALTLMIGIVCSLFSALVLTRLVFDIMASKGMKINVG
ncbi:MAG: protein translocase subunit SecD [Bacteroidetes bacterium]|nr:protein translocase subunit SecD [Bacteroidota bacterium]